MNPSIFHVSRAARFRRITSLTMAMAAVLTASTVAQSAPIQYKRTIKNANAVQAGVTGVASGAGSIQVTGVSGTVSAAYLYWHGINAGGSGAVYDNATIMVDGRSVTGVPQGLASSTNCWGPGSSRTYEADVTSIVRGNGSYALSGLARQAGYRANGASLVVVFDDGNRANNRDYVFFTGNDSIYADGAFPDDANGWSLVQGGLTYRGGTVRVSTHVADGQAFEEQPLTFRTAHGQVVVADTPSLFDGVSVPNAGDGQGLFDIHTFDVSAAFGGVQGPAQLEVTAQPGADCLALTTVVIDLEQGGGPFTTCAAEGITGAKLTLCKKICETDQSPRILNGLIRLYVGAYREQPACAR